MNIKYDADSFNPNFYDDYPPRCGCPFELTGYPCTSWACSRHGQKNRIVIVEPFELISPIDDCFVAVLNYGDFRFPSQVASARDDFKYRLRNDVQVLWWTLHFIDKRPHLNLCFRQTSMVLHKGKIWKVIRQVWREIIHAKFGTVLGRKDAYIDTMKKGWTACVRYFYQTTKQLPPSECPPVMPRVIGKRKSYTMHSECELIRQLRKDAKLLPQKVPNMGVYSHPCPERSGAERSR